MMPPPNRSMDECDASDCAQGARLNTSVILDSTGCVLASADAILDSSALDALTFTDAALTSTDVDLASMDDTCAYASSSGPTDDAALLAELQLRILEYEADLRTLRATLANQRQLTDLLQKSLVESASTCSGSGMGGFDDNELAMPPLVIACKSGDLSMIDVILTGTCVAKSTLDLALLVACQSSMTDAAVCVLDAGADLHVDHDSALLWACRTGNAQLVRCLLDRGANADVLGGCALRIAVRAGFLEISAMLVHHMGKR